MTSVCLCYVLYGCPYTMFLNINYKNYLCFLWDVFQVGTIIWPFISWVSFCHAIYTFQQHFVSIKKWHCKGGSLLKDLFEGILQQMKFAYVMAI